MKDILTDWSVFLFRQTTEGCYEKILVIIK